MYDRLSEFCEPKSYGTIVRYRPILGESTISTIILGLPDVPYIPAFSLLNRIANNGILVICNRAVPAVFGSRGPTRTWPGAVRYEEIVRISNISVGGKDCL